MRILEQILNRYGGVSCNIEYLILVGPQCQRERQQRHPWPEYEQWQRQQLMQLALEVVRRAEEHWDSETVNRKMKFKIRSLLYAE